MSRPSFIRPRKRIRDAGERTIRLRKPGENDWMTEEEFEKAMADSEPLPLHIQKEIMEAKLNECCEEDRSYE